MAFEYAMRVDTDFLILDLGGITVIVAVLVGHWAYDETDVPDFQLFQAS